MSRVTSALRGVPAMVGSQALPEGQAKIVGKYRVLCELGRGGMANVFLAVTQGTGGVNKLVVLKALLPDVASEPDALAMFLDEARLAAQLNHGNVVQTYEVGEEGGRQVIVMEYLEGQSLASILRRAGQTTPLALHLRAIVHVLEGLHYVHELRGYDGQPLELVHRDVSPQNVFVTYDGRVKVLDFGIAKAATSTTHTATGAVKGKIAYMCPEQMSGDIVDRRADVYSVGCMLWAAAAGRKLWKDVADAHILRDVMNDAVPSPKSVNPSCDDELNRIVMKALANKPQERYSSAFELQADLERYCDETSKPDRPRELARFVSTLFVDARDDLRGRVERELSTLASGVGFPVPEAQTHSRLQFVSDAQPITSATRTVSGSTVNALPRPVSKPQRGLWLVAGLVALLAGAFFLASPAKPSGVAVAPANLPSTAKVVPLRPEPLTARIEFRSTPGNARLFLDGQALIGNPALRVMPADGTPHQLRAELEGYEPASADFSATRDQVVDLQLGQLLPPPETKRRTVAPRRTSSPAKKPQAATAGCAQPFFVDTDGIKKVRPGCL